MKQYVILKRNGTWEALPEGTSETRARRIADHDDGVVAETRPGQKPLPVNPPEPRRAEPGTIEGHDITHARQGKDRGNDPTGGADFV